MTTTKQTVLGITSGGQFQGSVVWWGLTDALVDEAGFRARWSAAGLSPNVLPQRRNPHRNLSDGAKLALIGVDGYLVRPITRAGVFGATTKLAIIREDRDPGHDLCNHTQESVVTLVTTKHPSDPDVVVSTFSISAPHPIADRIKAEWERLEGSYTATEIRKAIVNTLGGPAAAVPLREHGGVYWVPPTASATVDALREVINATGQSQFDVLPLFATAIGTASVASAASRSVYDEVAKLQAEVEQFKAEAPRSDVLGRRLKEYDDLRQRARLYRDVLSLDVTSLEASLVELEKTVDVMMQTPSPTVAA